MRWLDRPTRCSRRETPFRRADLDHLVHPAPVDAEIQRGRGDDGAQVAAGHRRFHPAALGDVQAAMVQGDRQGGVVQLPQRLEQQFALRAGVDEHDGHAGRGDPLQDDGGGGEPHAAGPGYPLLAEPHLQLRRGAVRHVDGGDGAAAADIGLDAGAVGDGGGQAGAAGGGGEVLQPGQAERQLVAALGAGQGMDLVDDHAAQAGEQGGGVGLAAQQGQAFRRGQQDVGGRGLLPGPLGGGGVAGPRLDRDGQAPSQSTGAIRLRAMSVASAFSGDT